LDQGTAAQLGTVRHSWEDAVITYRIFNTVQQALKKQIITVFEPMYLEILNDDMVGFANIRAREMLDHLFLTYGNITAVDLENNFEQMRKAWDPSSQWRPCSSKFKIALTFRRQEEYLLAILRKSMWAMPIFLQQAISRAPVADGTRRTLRTRHGQTSRCTSLQLTANTIRCMGNHPPIQDIMQKIQLLVTLKNKCKKQPLTLWKIWKLTQPLTVVWSQL
jgi:hypothetical protein